MFKVNNKDTRTTPNFEHIIAGWETLFHNHAYNYYLKNESKNEL